MGEAALTPPNPAQITPKKSYESLRMIDSISGVLKHLAHALAVPLAAAMWLGAGPPAQAIPTDSLIHYDFNSVSGTPATTQIVEYGGDLSGWTPVAIPETSAGIVEITPGSPSDHVKVAIPNQGSQTFVRLKVSQ
jgi:hypothetical protein